ncbi:hypothetical protein [Streptomyces sp. NPDC055186]
MLGSEEDPIPGRPYHIRKLAVTPHDFADDAADALLDLRGRPQEPDGRRATHEVQRARAHRAMAERNVASTQSLLEAAKKLTGQAKGLLDEARPPDGGKAQRSVRHADTPDYRLREGKQRPAHRRPG